MRTESKRQQRFAGIIQADLAELFQREGREWFPGAFVTVTRVRMTPDLAIARVFLSFLQADRAKSDMETLKSHASEIRFKLGAKIKHQARIVPQLEFFIDDTQEYVAHMDKLFASIEQDTSKDESSDNADKDHE
jgi:ribosome-binding factor A